MSGNIDTNINNSQIFDKYFLHDKIVKDVSEYKINAVEDENIVEHISIKNNDIQIHGKQNATIIFDKGFVNVGVDIDNIQKKSDLFKKILCHSSITYHNDDSHIFQNKENQNITIENLNQNVYICAENLPQDCAINVYINKFNTTCTHIIYLKGNINLNIDNSNNLIFVTDDDFKGNISINNTNPSKNVYIIDNKNHVCTNNLKCNKATGSKIITYDENIVEILKELKRNIDNLFYYENNCSKYDKNYFLLPCIATLIMNNNCSYDKINNLYRILFIIKDNIDINMPEYDNLCILIKHITSKFNGRNCS